MKIKTSKLTSAALDWAVAVADGKIEVNRSDVWCGFRPSNDWSQAGEIIEKFEICIAKVGRSIENAIAPHPDCWCAHIDGVWCMYAETPLIAAMRCYVASKLGDTIEVPDEFLK